MAKSSTVKSVTVFCAFALSFFILIEAEISENGNALTIQWYANVTAEKVEADTNSDPTKHLAEWTTLYEKVHGGSVFIQGTNFTSQYPDSISWRASSGFVDTVFYSYRKHHSLIIRPDDVWIAIIVQFSFYVNANAEALRHKFVNFDGKKTLEVSFFTPIDEVPIDVFITKIVAMINENIGPTVSNWITPNFTTTTENDKLTAGAALMATLQRYYEFKMFLRICGIPEVTILGDADDWKEIRQRVEKLKEYELNGGEVMAIWSTMLGRILSEFVRVKEGLRKDDEFWRQAISVEDEYVRQGCGITRQSFLDGWITTFSLFDKLGNWLGNYKTNPSAEWYRLRTVDITHGVVNVPIQVYDQFARPEQQHYNAALITGHMGYSVKMDEVTIQPLSGWAMTITDTPPDYLQYKSRKTAN